MRPDHLLHLFAGLAVALVFGFAVSPAFGLVMGFGIGLGKEAFDYLSGNGTVEFSDTIATWLGASAGAATAWGLT